MGLKFMEYCAKQLLSNFLLAAFLMVFCGGIARAQDSVMPKAPENSQSAAKPGDDYTVGPGDVLSVNVIDAPEFGGKFRVSDTGVINIPGVPNPVHAEGQTSIELSRTIQRALVDAKQLRNPKVTVFVEEYRGRTITILGAVSKPSVYPLQKRMRVIEALSMAGGVLPGAGDTVTLVRGPASAEATGTPEGSVEIIPAGRLLKGEDLKTNVEVRNGDVLNVSAAQVVYVVGAVVKPGGYVMADPSTGVSVVQAVALAQGFTPTASTKHAIIVRQSTSDSARKEIPVDLGQMQRGKLTDMVLAPNDILFVPQSGTKITLQYLSQAAMAAVTGVAYYGLGYRVATNP